MFPLPNPSGEMGVGMGEFRREGRSANNMFQSRSHLRALRWRTACVVSEMIQEVLLKLSARKLFWWWHLESLHSYGNVTLRWPSCSTCSPLISRANVHCSLWDLCTPPSSMAGPRRMESWGHAGSGGRSGPEPRNCRWRRLVSDLLPGSLPRAPCSRHSPAGSLGGKVQCCRRPVAGGSCLCGWRVGSAGRRCGFSSAPPDVESVGVCLDASWLAMTLLCVLF